MTVKNFVQIVWTVFEEMKNVQKQFLFGPIWANCGFVAHILIIQNFCQCCNRTAIWCRTTRKFHSKRIDSFREN